MLTDTQITPILAQSRRDISIRSGDTVRVHQKIVEKDKTRIQVFEGVVIAHKHGNEAGATFTVRRVGSDGIAVEKIFPLYSPMIDKIEITRRAKVRRSRLYFLRDKTPKQIREKLRRTTIVSETTTDTEPTATEPTADTTGDTTSDNVGVTVDTTGDSADSVANPEPTANPDTEPTATEPSTDTEPTTDTIETTPPIAESTADPEPTADTTPTTTEPPAETTPEPDTTPK